MCLSGRMCDDGYMVWCVCRASLNHVPPVRLERPTIQDAAQIQSTMRVAPRR